ncbi:MAG: CBS domain-containing protein [Anaerolineales bacterium]|nr:CBS domain-containing protein [Anaerolineales bacterium]
MLLDKKGSQVFSVSPETPVFDALKLMSEKGIGAVLVLEEDGHVAGIMSERDYARKVALKGRTAADTPVAEIMTEQVICVEPSQPIQECMALMVGKRIRHLPVLEGGQLAGIISIGDVVADLISEQETLISQLESYIRGY